MNTMVWIIRILFAIAASITALFVERDALNFGVMQMLVSVMLITVVVGAAALWSMRRRQARDAADHRP
jgi:hypothetical protein